MKFENLVEICLWPHFAVKGLSKCMKFDWNFQRGGGGGGGVVGGGGGGFLRENILPWVKYG